MHRVQCVLLDGILLNSSRQIKITYEMSTFGMFAVYDNINIWKKNIFNHKLFSEPWSLIV